MEKELTKQTIDLFNGTYHGIWYGRIIELKDYKGLVFYTFGTIDVSKSGFAHHENVSVTIENHKVVDWDYL